jgi:hypothetical protein
MRLSTTYTAETHLHERAEHSQARTGVRLQSVLSLAKLAGTDQRYYLEQAQRQVDHTHSVTSGLRTTT